METLIRDDLAHALAQLMGFYGKKLDQAAVRFWFHAFARFDPEAVKAAMLEYTSHGKYAPKPVDIIEILRLQRDEERAHLPPPEEHYTRCPDHIAKAWQWFIPMTVSGSKDFEGVFRYDTRDIDPETQERYLQTVNREAKAHNQPDAIPREFKLQEVWG